MNEIEKPDKCRVAHCQNNAYEKDYLTKEDYIWVCRKHHYMYAYGYSEKEASYK